VPSLLVTNDFPPKVGGIQSYLWELWRRLPAEQVTVLASRYPGDREFDGRQGFRIERAKEWWLLPTPDLARRIDALAVEVGADVILLDPVFPLAALGPRLHAAPVVVVVHGAELSVPARLPGASLVVRRALRHASGVVAAGGFPAGEAARATGGARPTLVIPPGVDVTRFHPPADVTGRATARALRARLGLGGDGPVVVGASRLVRRKGFDTLLDAVARLDDDVALVLVGAGRDRPRLERRAVARGVDHRVRFLGRVPDGELVEVLGAADVFAMLCRDRWGGLEYEGFGIVFVEAAACGVPSVAGRSGGSAEAVLDGETGFVVAGGDVGAAVEALGGLLADPARRAAMGAAARARVEAELSYDRLAERLRPLACGDLGALDGRFGAVAGVGSAAEAGNRGTGP
jgi:phosphatidylinositol alpha-1,6-mannosyltransferase